MIGEHIGRLKIKLTTAHQQYYTHLFDDPHTNNNKRFWSLVKKLRKNHQSIPTLSVDNDLKISPSSKAEALNQQFYSVFTRENKNHIPPISFTIDIPAWPTSNSQRKEL